jgi:hypothetical protein
MPPAPAARQDPKPDRKLAAVPNKRTVAEPHLELAWEDPPVSPTHGRQPLRDRLATILEQVKERPGTWARVATYERKSSANSGANGLRKKPPAGRWEFKGCKLDNGSALYARYLGDNDKAE